MLMERQEMDQRAAANANKETVNQEAVSLLQNEIRNVANTWPFLSPEMQRTLVQHRLECKAMVLRRALVSTKSSNL
ncbi:unnamed protein product [Ilex paraguariensis]